MSRRTQTGLALTGLILVLLIAGAAYALAARQNSLSLQVAQQARTVKALAQARALLKDYAQSFHLVGAHAVPTPGFLPCPDGDSDGSADMSCGSAGVFAVGRFPYRTLGAEPLRDGQGECLWYAVAGNFKYNPYADRMNWDVPGQFDLRAADGRLLNASSAPLDRAVAVVFAPGPALTGQQRSLSPNRHCNGPADAALALTNYLETAFPTPGTGTLDIEEGIRGDATNNDQIAWLSARELFDPAFLRRPDVTTLIDGMLDTLEPALAGAPSPATPRWVAGNVVLGALPESITDPVIERWRDQFLYLACEPGAPACMTLSSSAAPLATCNAVVLFSGQAVAGAQARPGGVEAYFEAALSALPSPDSDTVVAEPVYDGRFPARDLARCLP